jgi:hypothetical protein
VDPEPTSESSQNRDEAESPNILDSQDVAHGLFLERVYEIELDTKTEYEGF